jgi:hypothetical protein
MRTFPMASPMTGNAVEDVNTAIATMRPPAGYDPGLERARGMWAKQDKPAYRSLGLKPHVDKAADQLGFKDRSLLLRAEQTWHMSQIQNSLGYLSDATLPKAQRDLLERVTAIRNALFTAVVAADSAIKQAADALGLPVDLLTVEPAQPFTVDEPSPLTVDPAPSIPQWEEETADESEQLRPAVDSAEQHDVQPASKRRRRRSAD